MTLLSLKARLYRYTGLYLASKEELDYITSREFWEAYEETIGALTIDDDMSPQNVQGLLRGMWCLKNGLMRPCALLEYEFSGVAWKKFHAYLVNCCVAMYDDFRRRK